jgi:hypothetical protein
MRRALRHLMIPLVTVPLVLAFQATPASAHEPTVFIDSAGFGQIVNNHHDVVACDTAADDLGVRTRYVANGVTSHVRDLNGSQPGCGVAQGVGTVTTFQVCVHQSGVILRCTPWSTA